MGVVQNPQSRRAVCLKLLVAIGCFTAAGVIGIGRMTGDESSAEPAPPPRRHVAVDQAVPPPSAEPAPHATDSPAGAGASVSNAPRRTQAEGAPAVVAVVSTQAEHDHAVLVEATLLAQAGRLNVRMVERERLAAVLAELELSATALMDPATAVRLGELLAADVLVVLQPLGEGEQAPLRLRAVETKSAIVLSDTISGPEQASEAAAEVLTHALAKRQVPVPQRRYIAIGGFTSEVDHHDSQRVVQTLEPLLASGLQQRQEVVVLERQELRRLVQEKIIGGNDQRFLGAAILVEGSVRPLSDQQGYRLRLQLTSVGTDQAPVHELTSQGESLLELRQQMVALCLAEKIAAGHAPNAARAAAEADRLMERAQWLLRGMSACDTAAFSGKEAEPWRYRWRFDGR